MKFIFVQNLSLCRDDYDKKMKLGWILCVCFIYFSEAVKGGEADDCNFCAWDTCDPSIVAIDESKFNPEKDARTIWKSIGNLFVDKEKIINILSARTEKQRLAIVSKYSELFNGWRLKEDIFDVTFGDVSVVLQDLVTPLSTFYGKYLKRALKKKDIIRITEIFTILPPCAIQQIHKKYEDVYSIKLNEDIRASLSLKYPMLNVIDLILLLGAGNRPPTADKRGTKNWNKKVANDVKELVKVLEQDKWDDKHKVFKKLFSERTLPQLQDIIINYEIRKGPLDDGIKKAKFEGAEPIYMTILNIVRNQPEYFSLKLNELLKPRYMLSVNRQELNYIIVGRSSIDLKDINKAFLDKYGISLYLAILTKTTRRNNDYYKVILSLIQQD